MRRLTDYLKDYTLQVLWIWDHLSLSISGFFYTDTVHFRIRETTRKIILYIINEYTLCTLLTKQDPNRFHVDVHLLLTSIFGPYPCLYLLSTERGGIYVILSQQLHPIRQS